MDMDIKHRNGTRAWTTNMDEDVETDMETDIDTDMRFDMFNS
jgi:hypothetical protein